MSRAFNNIEIMYAGQGKRKARKTARRVGRAMSMYDQGVESLRGVMNGELTI
jgi:hypothetical protein